MKIYLCLLFLLGGTGAHTYSNKNLVRRQISTSAPNTEASTRIPPSNPEVTTVYRVSCPCPFTPQYAPVCGSDGQNYGNMQILNCAKFCGSNVTMVYPTACGSNRG